MKVLTISVAAYNSAEYLDRCIRSFEESGVIDNLDIIIVNDGSTDNTQEIAESISKKHPDSVSVINKDNGGHGSTINTSIKIAKGKYYKIVDADDWVEPGGLKELVDLLKNATSDIVSNPYYRVDAESDNKTIKYDSVDRNNIGQVIDIDSQDPDMLPAMHSLTFRTDVIRTNWKDLDEHCFYVDVEYLVYCFNNCSTILNLDFPVYDYLIGTSGQSINYRSLIKRRSEHERVLWSCIKYSDESNLDKAGVRNRIIRNRIEEHILAQYKIFLSMSYIYSKKEISEFDSRLREMSNLYYDECVNNSTFEALRIPKVVSWLRKRHFKRYLPVNVMYRIRYGTLI